MNVDYIVVGFGLAGLALVDELEKSNKSFVVFDNNPSISSRIIGGMYNPIILKRFTPAWKAHEMLQTALPFYKDLERKFSKKYIFPSQIYRILYSVEEQNNWIVASDKHIMSQYMNPEIQHFNLSGIHAPFGYGVLNNVGRINGEEILEDYTNYLEKKKCLFKETFYYEKLKITDDAVSYNQIKAKKIVFAEGSYLPNNPFFKYLPMRSAKGELLVIDVPGVAVKNILKSGVFMVPFGEQKYIVGATYNWEDKSFEPTEQAVSFIDERLRKFLELPYTIIDRKVGIRPTIKDRRPIVGIHPLYKNLAILNGLGTRGIIIAPFIAKSLLANLEKNIPLDKSINIDRFVS